MRKRWLGMAVPVVALGLVIVGVKRAPSPKAAPAAAAPAAIVDDAEAIALRQRTAPTPPSLAGLDLSRIVVDKSGAVALLSERRTAKLTLEPRLQHLATSYMNAQHLPEGVVVLMDVATGNLLAYASHIEGAHARDLAVEATAPAASLFKIVTGTALVDTAGVSPDHKECYSGGEQRILAHDLVSDPARDKWCATLAGAMGRSLNTVFARLAVRHLKPESLEATARSLGFGEPLAFDVPVQASTLTMPTETLAFARTSAGFWNSTISPLHAAWLSATMARGGEPIRPRIVAEVTDPSGKNVYTAPAPQPGKRLVPPAVAAAVTQMMDRTVAEGTSYKAFHDLKGHAHLPGVPVAGKTGTLTDGEKQRYYTWFTGFAPSHPQPGQKQVAVAVLVVNGPVWRVKANVVAREMLRGYFALENTPQVTFPEIHTPSVARRKAK
ncbi:MAG TPA: penicillin-binding transpeptidase domain-containing protein [Polyangiaceae bacterium]|nr:penicillin-binding transpeptidase domain-containing protein [Polyangiaceae bacterium]